MDRVLKSLISLDIYVYVKNTPECMVVSGRGKVQPPQLCSIPVTQLFQTLRMDTMALPRQQEETSILVFQDFLLFT